MATWNETKQVGRRATMAITNRTTKDEVSIGNLRVKFKLKKKAKVNANTAKIEVYNLSFNSRKLIQTAVDAKGVPRTHVELRVGYVKDEDLKIIFRGLCSVESKYKAPDWITTFKGEDGEAQLKYIFEDSFPAKTKLRVILEKIIKYAGLDPDLVDYDDYETEIPKRLVVSGPPMRLIKDLQRTYNFTFTVIEDSAIVKSNKYKLNTSKLTSREIILLDRKTGLLGKPITKGNLVIVECLINGHIKPSNYIRLQSLDMPFLNADYSIRKVETQGDNWGSKWAMKVEMVKVDEVEFIETKET